MHCSNALVCHLSLALLTVANALCMRLLRVVSHVFVIHYILSTQQFGFCTLFVVAFPLAPLCGLISIYVELRIDSYKLVSLLQRPVPRGAADIGRWQHILTFIAVASISTNSAIICFVFDSGIGTFSQQWRVWSFVIMQYALFTLYFLVRSIIPDVPLECELQLKRQAFLCQKLIDRYNRFTKTTVLFLD
jgi:Calcium-activated chloride channel